MTRDAFVERARALVLQGHDAIIGEVIAAARAFMRRRTDENEDRLEIALCALDADNTMRTDA